MLQIIRNLLLLSLDAIDSGNTNISEAELLELVDILIKINSLELSKIESANYLGVCRATFDNYIKKKFIPEGHKRLGFNELSWYKSDLDKFLKDGNIRKKL